MDIIYSLTIFPKLILDLFFGENTISFKFYMIQFSTEHLFDGSEVSLLFLMALDCYLAICKPLRYLIIMRKWMCVMSMIVA
jgi:olfactory receptor